MLLLKEVYLGLAPEDIQTITEPKLIVAPVSARLEGNRTLANVKCGFEFIKTVVDL